MFKPEGRLRYFTQAAMIGALYAILTIIAAPISYGMVQVRIAEALTVLPFFTPAAVPGLFVGCLLANIFGGHGILDIVFGSLATLIAAFFVSKIKLKYLAPMPPVLVNAVIVGLILYYVLDLHRQDVPLIIPMLWVGLGQLVACYGLGLPLLLFLEKRPDIFK